MFEAENFEKILEVFGSEEYRGAVVKDELEFIDRSRTQIYAVNLASIIDKARL